MRPKIDQSNSYITLNGKKSVGLESVWSWFDGVTEALIRASGPYSGISVFNHHHDFTSLYLVLIKYWCWGNILLCTNKGNMFNNCYSISKKSNNPFFFFFGGWVCLSPKDTPPPLSIHLLQSQIISTWKQSLRCKLTSLLGHWCNMTLYTDTRLPQSLFADLDCCSYPIACPLGACTNNLQPKMKLKCHTW